MRAKQHKAAEEDSGGEVGLWYVSFADMITLLLSFFVMLTSFSSFDKESIEQLHETSARAYPSIISCRQRGNNSLVDLGYSSPIQTHGTESTIYPTWGVEHPETKQTEALDYSRRKIIRLPLTGTFLGNSSALTPSGKQCVELMAKYLSATPYHIRLAADGDDKTLALVRGWNVAALLGKNGVNIEHIGLALPEAIGDLSRDQLVLLLLPERTSR